MSLADVLERLLIEEPGLTPVELHAIEGSERGRCLHGARYPT